MHVQKRTQACDRIPQKQLSCVFPAYNVRDWFYRRRALLASPHQVTHGHLWGSREDTRLYARGFVVELF